jgi:hypothetical protein
MPASEYAFLPSAEYLYPLSGDLVSPCQTVAQHSLPIRRLGCTTTLLTTEVAQFNTVLRTFKILRVLHRFVEIIWAPPEICSNVENFAQCMPKYRKLSKAEGAKDILHKNSRIFPRRFFLMIKDVTSCHAPLSPGQAGP